MRRLITVAFSVVFVSAAHADIIYVNTDSQTNGPGTSWTTAFVSLEDGLAAASAGDEVWVAAGTYSLTGARESVFNIPGGVSVYGGFVGGEASPAERPADFSQSATILSGLTNNAYTVVLLGPGTSPTLLDRVIIQDGNSDGATLVGTMNGGGMFANLRSDLTLNDVLFRNCEAVDNGAGLYAFREKGATTTLTMNGVRFLQCDAEGRGGGAAISVDTTLVNCEFSNCEAYRGGGLYCEDSVTIDIADSTFTENTATDLYGGGILFELGGSGQSNIDRSVFADNVALNSGGGGIAYTELGSHNLRESTLRGNRVEGNSASGGAIMTFLTGSNVVNIESCLITGNEAAFVGAGIHATPTSNSITRLANCTVVGNRSINGAVGAINYTSGEIILRNTIVWGNSTVSPIAQQAWSLGGSAIAGVTVANSIIHHLGVVQPPPAGSNNTSDDPMFDDIDGPDDLIGTEDDNASLMPGSPAIDAGNSNDVISSSGLDVNGDPRFADDTGTADSGISNGVDPVVDIGAAEFQGTTPSDCVADVNNDGMLTPTDFTAWINAFNNNLPECDQNSDGSCTPTDFTAWIANFNAGC
ncbi:MAG: hypothetical protein Phyf2KO_26390 [Phycisphaerales bacterium]